MNSLRLILLILGIAVMAGIFIWDNIQRRKEKRLRTIDISSRRMAPPTINIGSGEDDDMHILSLPGVRAAAGPSDLFNKNAALENDGLKQKDRRDIKPDQIVVLHVTAREEQLFSGENIINALEQLNFQFGKMNIFHHYGLDEIKSEYPLFSAVNMMEPGHFDPDTISQLATPGISLFLCLPAPVDGEVVFEFMLSIAQQLAGLLGGEVRNEAHQRIDAAKIADIKKKIIKT